jgi:hypothetical protein
MMDVVDNRQYRLGLAALVVLGLAIRLTVDLETDGVAFDLESFAATNLALHLHGFSAYEFLAPGRWPYPPGYFPWVLVAGKIADVADFTKVIRLPPMAADVGIALIVQELLRRAGASRERRVAAVALVMLGPIFIGVAGHNGQLDPVAILPALAAYWVWTARELDPRRALYAGALIGIAASIKTVPLLMVLALAPSARSGREAAVLAATAGATLALVFAPFLLATPEDALRVFSYHGVPGFGGISVFAQPGFAQDVLAGKPVHATDALLFMRDHGHEAFLVPALLALAGLLAWRRPDPLTAIVLLWLTVYTFGGNFFLQYLVWGLPFLLVRGHLAWVAAIQLFLTPALLLVYNAPVPETAAMLGYTVPIVIAWITSAVALGVMVTNVVREGDASARAEARAGARGT